MEINWLVVATIATPIYLVMCEMLLTIFIFYVVILTNLAV